MRYIHSKYWYTNTWAHNSAITTQINDDIQSCQKLLKHLIKGKTVSIVTNYSQSFTRIDSNNLPNTLLIANILLLKSLLLATLFIFK